MAPLRPHKLFYIALNSQMWLSKQYTSDWDVVYSEIAKGQSLWKTIPPGTSVIGR